MVKKIGLGVVVLLVAFFGYVATKDGHFNYEKNDFINSSQERIFPFISNLKMGEHWSPYEKMDPTMKKTFSGNDGEVGSAMDFEGNSDAGSGRLEIVGMVPNKSVDIKLTMTKPFHAENLIQYKLTPEGAGTRFSWAMSGDGGYLGKLMSTLIDCEKMVTDQFLKGIINLKSVTEGTR